MTSPPRHPDGLPAAVARAWGLGTERQRRGPVPSLTIATIREAALAVADDGKRGGPSLSAVAKRLGVTTNALYRHLDSRAELDAIAADMALGDPPTIAPTQWRQEVHEWVNALRTRHLAHPWLIDVQRRAPLMPGVLGWLDTLLEVLDRAALEPAEAMRAAAVIDSYVRAEAASRVLDEDDAVRVDADRFSSAADTLAELARQRRLDRVADLLAADIMAPNAAGNESFDAGLDLILDGIATRRPSAPCD